MKYEGEIDLGNREYRLEELMGMLLVKYPDKWGSFYLMVGKNAKPLTSPKLSYKNSRIEDQNTLKAMLKKYGKKDIDAVYYSDWRRNMNYYIYFA